MSQIIKIPQTIKGYRHIDEVIDESLEKIVEIAEGRLKPLVSSITAERKKIGGLFPGELMTIAARTGMGKSARVTQLIRDYLDEELNPFYKDKLIILFDNWEMIDWRNMIRMYSATTKMTVRELLDYENRLTAERIKLIYEVANEFRGKPLYFNNMSNSVAKWEENKHNYQKLFPEHTIVNIIDHTRLVTNKNERSEEQLITNFIKAMMRVKKELKQICIPLSQMNRNIESNSRGDDLGNKLPISSDLFGSDAVFQGSDIVMALHRPGYYGLVNFVNGKDRIPTGLTDDENSTDNLMIECILKQRDGWTGNILVEHQLKYNSFSDFKFKKKTI